MTMSTKALTMLSDRLKEKVREYEAYIAEYGASRYTNVRATLEDEIDFLRTVYREFLHV